MRKLLLSVLILLCCFQTVEAAGIGENPQSICELIALGLKTNLGLQVEMLNAAKSADEIVVEEASFDSRIFVKTGYNRSSTPYESSFSLTSTSFAEKFSGQVGINKRFRSGLQATLSLNSAWDSDNDLSNALDSRYRTALVLDLNQPLLRNLGTSINLTQFEISQNKQRQAALGYLLRAQQLALQLESVVRQLAAETEVIRLRQEALNLAAELLAANRKRFRAGVVAITQIQEAETALAARQLGLSLAIQERNLLRESLNRQLDHCLAKQFTAAGLIDFDEKINPVNLPDFDHQFESARQKRLELKINTYALRNSSLQRDYLHNQLKPQLDLNFQAGIDGLSGDRRHSVSHSQYTGDWFDSFSSMGEVDGYQWRFGLEFSLPLGNRQAKSRLHQSELQLKQDKYQRRDIVAAIKNDVLQQQVNIAQNLEQLQIAERFEKLAETSMQQEQRRLDEGLSDTFRIIFFQDKMITAKIDRINALTRYQLALAQMDFATGNIFNRHHIVLTRNTEELNLEDI